MIEHLTGSLGRRRVLVLVLWLGVVVLGAVSAQQLPRLLSASLSVPGTPSERADSILARHFAESVDGSFTVVLPPGRAAQLPIAVLERRVAAAARVLPGGRLTGGVVRSGGIAYGEVTTPLSLQPAAALTSKLRAALGRAGLARAEVTGAPALQHDLTPLLAADLRRGELIGLAVALAVLLAVLGPSPLVLVPFAVAAATVAGTLGVVFLLAHRVLMVLYVPNLVALIGLGLSIDYSLLIVQRFRHELATDGDVQKAISQTMVTAGRTVVMSGVAVAVGLSALLLVPVPFVRSLALAGLLVPLISIAVALTLQPTLLALLGGASVRRAVGAPNERVSPSLWTRLGLLVVARRGLVLVGSLGLILLACVPALSLRVSAGSLATIPATLPSARALDLLSERLAPGLVSPTEVVIDAGAPGAARSPRVAAATLRLADELLHQPEAYVVAIGSRPPYLDRSGRDRLVSVIGRHDFGAASAAQLVTALRTHLVAAARFPPGTRVDVGGAPAEGQDFVQRVDGVFPLLVAIVLLLACAVLVPVFGSLLLPLIATLLDLLSVGAAYGLVVLVFRFGVGAGVLGVSRADAVEAWVPVLLFVMLFGLSMDYQVFIVARMREAYDAGASADAAIVEGLGRTGPIVSAAALIMVGSLSGLVFGAVVGLQELGVGLVLGVLVDVTLVRGLLLPSLIALCGRRSWWFPRKHAPLARHRPSPLGEGR